MMLLNVMHVVNGKVGLVLTLSLIITLSKENLLLVLFTTTRPLNNYITSVLDTVEHSAEMDLVG